VPNAPIIEVQGLSKTFRTFKKEPGIRGALKSLIRREYEQVHAVKDVGFTVQEGEFVGFLGPNGAGKTTTLKMLSGLLHPTSGKARVLGYVPWERADGYRRQFALLLGQKNQLWWDLPASESLALNARIYGIPVTEAQKTVDELSELLDVRAKLNVMVRELSLGERMKMELIAALLHGPRVLFLDEPTIGLDVVSQRAVRSFLRDYNRRHRTTILLTSHYMADIKELCERVIVIHKGSKIYDGGLARLDAGPARKIVRFRPVDGHWPSTWQPPGRVIEQSTDSIALEVDAARVVAVCQDILNTGGVADFTVEDVPLEDVIHRLFSDA
jgi:ABC-2 type transport system ATP-binding protein